MRCSAISAAWSQPSLHRFKERQPVAKELVVGILEAPFPKPLIASA